MNGMAEQNMILHIFILLNILHIAWSQCIYHKRMFRNIIGKVLKTHIITDFDDGCETLCYWEKCMSANVLPLDDGTYQCNFMSRAIPSSGESLLEESPGGKCFGHSPVLGPEENVALVSHGATCTQSSAYTSVYNNETITSGCYRAIEGDTDGYKRDKAWAIDNLFSSNGYEAWINISFPAQMVVTRVVLYQRYYIMTQVMKAEIYSSDGSIIKADDLNCTSKNSFTPGDVINIVPVITRYITINVTETCADEEAARYVGFREIEVFGWPFGV